MCSFLARANFRLGYSTYVKRFALVIESARWTFSQRL